jgi:hypothetical protein
VAQVTAELPLVFETVAQVPELLALVLIQMAAVVGARALAVGMAAVALAIGMGAMALIAEMPLAPKAVTMAMALRALSTPDARSRTPAASMAVTIPFALMARPPKSFLTGASALGRRGTRVISLGTKGPR